MTEACKLIKTVSVSGGRRRRHFVKEEDRDRKQMLAVFRELPGASIVCISTKHTSVIECRATLLRTLAAHLIDGGISRIVLDHVDDTQQRRDRRTLAAVLRGTTVTYGFESPQSTEIMLWVPDAVAWCAGRAGWRSDLQGWVTRITVA